MIEDYWKQKYANLGPKKIKLPKNFGKMKTSHGHFKDMKKAPKYHKASEMFKLWLKKFPTGTALECVHSDRIIVFTAKYPDFMFAYKEETKKKKS